MKDTTKRAGSVPAPSSGRSDAPRRRASSAHTADCVSQAFDRSIEEALALLLEASSAEKKKRAAAKPQADTAPKVQVAACGSTKKRVREAPTEEAALGILMVASKLEARRRRLMSGERAKQVDGTMSGAVPDEVCPAYGQSAPDIQKGSRGGGS